MAEISVLAPYFRISPQPLFAKEGCFLQQVQYLHFPNRTLLNNTTN